MGTRSTIAMENKDGSIVAVYCNSDGYIDGVGKILNNYYKKKKDVSALMKLGSLSCLYKNINPSPNSGHNFDNREKDVCVAYHRDRREDFHQYKFFDFNEYKNSDSCKEEFDYFYGNDKVWYLFYKQKLIKLTMIIERMETNKINNISESSEKFFANLLKQQEMENLNIEIDKRINKKIKNKKPIKIKI